MAYEGRGDSGEGEEVFRLALVAAVEASAAGQPGDDPFHDPAVPDAAGGEPSPQVAVVVACHRAACRAVGVAGRDVSGWAGCRGPAG